MQTIDFRLHHIVRYCGLERGNAFAVSFEETFHKIKGIEKLLQLNPRFYGWCYFGKIHSMYLYSDYDYEEWLEIQNLRMVMESEDKEYRVTLFFPGCHFLLSGAVCRDQWI